jgi:hypothetical protein
MIEKRNGGFVVICDTCGTACDEAAFPNRSDAIEDALWGDWEVDSRNGEVTCLKCYDLREWERKMKKYEIRDN